MAGDRLRVAKFIRTELFEETLQAFITKTPAVRERLKDFVAAKKRRPPGKFSNEHGLHRKLEGINECHLDADACLLYTDKDDTVTLLGVFSHDEITGKRAKSLAKKIRRAR
ncbi:MAG: type II toxin-antitoxin system YafQ family toxin [Proteobacteria bacterium]|nr:type II toxin-antitoxin system YafQ family toxin [Pseudomonadota bacterium]